jgi:hypothetical protein
LVQINGDWRAPRHCREAPSESLSVVAAQAEKGKSMKVGDLTPVELSNPRHCCAGSPSWCLNPTDDIPICVSTPGHACGGLHNARHRCGANAAAILAAARERHERSVAPSWRSQATPSTT